MIPQVLDAVQLTDYDGLHGSFRGTRAAFRRLLSYIEKGKIRPLLGRTCKLSDFHGAQAGLISRQYIGKRVVIPDSNWDKTGALYAQ